MTKRGEAKVLDFGLALHSTRHPSSWGRSRPATAKTSSSKASKASKAVGGTPTYMAPEAHEGAALTPAADQYSFATALIEALTGQEPFALRDPRALRLAKREGVSLRWLKHRGIQPALAEILVRAAHPLPALRYAGMDSLAAALRAWLRPSSVRPLLATSVLVLGSAAALYTVRDEAACEPEPSAASALWEDARPRLDAQWSRTAVVHGRARFYGDVDTFVAEWTRAATALCEPGRAPNPAQQQARSCLRERLGRLAAVLSTLVDVEPGVLARAYRLVDQFEAPAECLEPEYRQEIRPLPHRLADRLEVIEIRDVLARARALHAAGAFERGMHLAKQGLARATAVGFDPAKAEAMYEIGLLAVSSGDIVGGAEYLEQAYLSAEGRRHDRLAAAAAIRLVSVYGGRLMVEERAREWARRAQIAFERLEDDTKERAALEYNLGLIEHARGDLEHAKRHFQRALSAYEQLGERRDATTCRLSLGVIENMQGHAKRALHLFEAAYADARASLGLEHPDTATALSSLAGAQSSLGQLQLARENFATALDTFERAVGERHHSVAAGLINLGVVEFDLALYEDSLAHHQRALAIYESLLPEQHPSIAIALDNIGSLHVRLGRPQQAREEHARALDIRRAKLAPGSPVIASTHANLGLALAHLGRYDESRRQLDAAGSILAPGNASTERAWVILQRAKARRLMDDKPLDDLRSAVDELEALDQPLPMLVEARFLLAQQLSTTHPKDASQAARDALALARSLGIDVQAETIEAWLEAHPT